MSLEQTTGHPVGQREPCKAYNNGNHIPIIMEMNLCLQCPKSSNIYNQCMQCVCVPSSQCIRDTLLPCGSQRRTWFSPSRHVCSGIRLKSSDLVLSAFSCWSILSAQVFRYLCTAYILITFKFFTKGVQMLRSNPDFHCSLSKTDCRRKFY